MITKIWLTPRCKVLYYFYSTELNDSLASYTEVRLDNLYKQTNDVKSQIEMFERLTVKNNLRKDKGIFRNWLDQKKS